MLDAKNKSNNIMIIIAIPMLFFSFFGGEILGIKIGGMTFSFYRIFLAFSSIFLLVSNRFLNCNLQRLPLYFWFLLIWVVISFAQLIIATNLIHNLKYIYILLSAMQLLVYLFLFIDNEKKIKLVISVLTLSIVVNIMLCLIEMFTGKYFNLYGEVNLLYYLNNKNILGLYIPIAYWGNPNNVGLLCLCFAVILQIGQILMKRKIYKIINLFIILLNLLVWVATDSRTAYLSIFLFYYLLVLLSMNNRCLRALNMFILIIMMVIFSVIFLFNINLSIKGSNSIRLRLILNGIQLLFETYGFGVGAGNIEFHMQRIGNTYGIYNMHNWIMEIFASGGLIVGVFAIIFYFNLIKDLSIGIKNTNDKKVKSIFVVALAFILVFLFSSLAPSSCFGMDFHWVIFAVISVIINVYKKNNERLV